MVWRAVYDRNECIFRMWSVLFSPPRSERETPLRVESVAARSHVFTPLLATAQDAQSLIPAVKTFVNISQI